MYYCYCADCYYYYYPYCVHYATTDANNVIAADRPIDTTDADYWSWHRLIMSCFCMTVVALLEEIMQKLSNLYNDPNKH